jgi:ABC-type Fe3+-hydroxamate transport system substrate-binding protein
MRANAIAQQIGEAFSALSRSITNRRVAYFIWRQPWMTAGYDTFIHQMLATAGWTNVYGDQPRYPETDLETLKALQPEVVLLSSEPYPFKEQHIAELKAVLPQSKFFLVDGELFSWYGSRLLHTPAYLQQLAQEIEASFC